MRSTQKNLLIGIYYHPEGYPPTLNAIAELSKIYDHIDLVHRPHLKSDWNYPANLKLYTPGKLISAREQERSSLFLKMIFFAKFTFRMFKLSIQKRPCTILLYDAISLLAYLVIRPFLPRKHKVWYHSHDVVELKNLNKFSIGWFAVRAEFKKFHLLDIFSLPTTDRLTYYNMKSFRGKLFCIPNFPSISFYGSHYSHQKRMNEIKLLFQGRISKGHGIELIMEMIATETSYNVRLVLKGFCDPAYQEKLFALMKSLGVESKVDFLGLRPYKEIPAGAAECHIGVAIFESKDVMNSTLGTASNKVYEYAAAGLPVIYLKDSSIAETLEQYNWAHCIENNIPSIKGAVADIIENYQSYSASAYSSFIDHLNYEKQFQPVKEFLLKETEHTC